MVVVSLSLQALVVIDATQHRGENDVKYVATQILSLEIPRMVNERFVYVACDNFQSSLVFVPSKIEEVLDSVRIASPRWVNNRP